MRLMAGTLLGWGLVAAWGFLADYLWYGRGRPHGLTAHWVLWSSVGSGVVLTVGLVEMLAGRPVGWLHVVVGAFASVGYPAWWWRMRRLRTDTANSWVWPE